MYILDISTHKHIQSVSLSRRSWLVEPKQLNKKFEHRPVCPARSLRTSKMNMNMCMKMVSRKGETYTYEPITGESTEENYTRVPCGLL